MARRRLLIGEERRRLLDIPDDETAIVAHYTLGAEDLELVGRRYRPANRLGLATQITLMLHPGFGLQPDTDVPDAVPTALGTQVVATWDLSRLP